MPTLTALLHAPTPIGGTLAIALASALLPRPLDPPGDLLEFYGVAEASIAAPPSAATLRVACTQRVGTRDTHVDAAGWWSLLAPPDGGAVIAVFTREPLKDPASAISTTVRFGPLPTAKVTAASTLDWAWIWDRNGDGRADYAAYLQNAMAVLPDTVPPEWPVPVRRADGHYTVGLKLVEAIIDHAQLVFRHYADDDFDGTIDGVVFERISETFPMFVADRIVVRRTRRGAAVNAAASAPDDAPATEAWAFRHAITDTLATAAPGSTDSGIDGRADELIPFGTTMLGAVNRLAERCGAERGRIRRP